MSLATALTARQDYLACGYTLEEVLEFYRMGVITTTECREMLGLMPAERPQS
jgi:hypothetical protein